MRFKAKFDFGWTVLFIIVGTICVSDIVWELAQSPSRAFVLVTILFLGGAAVVLYLRVFPQSCEITEDGLFIRRGRMCVLIPYQGLRAVRPFQSGARGWAFSMDRILLVTNLPEPMVEFVGRPIASVWDTDRADADPFPEKRGRRFVVTIAEQGRFLAEIYKRCPRLDPAQADSIASLEASRIADGGRSPRG